MTPALVMAGDCRDELPHLNGGAFATCVTSPPFYGCFSTTAGDLPDPRRRRAIGSGAVSDYIHDLCHAFYEVRRVLRPDGRLWVALGDTTEPSGGWQGIPWRVALALRESGWRVLDAVPWCSGLTTLDADGRIRDIAETIFVLTPGAASLRSSCPPVWDIERPPIEPPAKFRSLPEEMVKRCLRSFTRPGDSVLDPFAGVGTVARVARRLGLASVSIELDPCVGRHAQERLAAEAKA